jgi:hypothetical protein
MESPFLSERPHQTFVSLPYVAFWVRHNWSLTVLPRPKSFVVPCAGLEELLSRRERVIQLRARGVVAAPLPDHAVYSFNERFAGALRLHHQQAT